MSKEHIFEYIQKHCLHNVHEERRKEILARILELPTISDSLLMAIDAECPDRVETELRLAEIAHKKQKKE